MCCFGRKPSGFAVVFPNARIHGINDGRGWKGQHVTKYETPSGRHLVDHVIQMSALQLGRDRGHDQRDLQTVAQRPGYDGA